VVVEKEKEWELAEIYIWRSLTELKTGGRLRGSSFALFSPNITPDSAIISTAQKFPFSIDRPPSTDVWTSNFSPYPTFRHMKRAAIASEAIPL